VPHSFLEPEFTASPARHGNGKGLLDRIGPRTPDRLHRQTGTVPDASVIHTSREFLIRSRRVGSPILSGFQGVKE